MNKKAQFAEFWLEYVAGALLVLAFYVAARGAYMGVVYLVALILGAMLGKFWYTTVRKKKTTVYIAILTMAVLLGMLLGSIGADRRYIVILFALGLCLSYAAHAEKWIRTA